jgi:hypothetical protein
MKRTQSIFHAIYVNVFEPTVEAFSSLFERLPATPWGYGTFSAKDLLNDPHTRPYAEFLRSRYPAEFVSWFHQVYSATVVANNENEEVHWFEAEIERHHSIGDRLASEFEQKRTILFQEGKLSSGQKGHTRTELDRRTQKLTSLENLSTWISCGLSVLIFLGLCDLFELDVLQLGENPIVGAMFALAAMSVSIGAKSQVAVFAERRFLAHARGSHLYVVFSRALIAALCVLFLAETGFAVPGLLTIFNNALEAGAGTVIAAIGAILGAGLFSATNLGLGLALGWEEAELSLWIEMKEEDIKNDASALRPLTAAEMVDILRLEIATNEKHIERLELRLERAKWRFNRAFHRARIEAKRFNRRARRITRQHRRLQGHGAGPGVSYPETLPLIEIDNGR